MTFTITFRFRSAPPAQPATARPAGQSGTGRLTALLPLAEPALLLLAEAAGVGFLGTTVLTAALRSAQRALASAPMPAAG